MSHPDFPHMMPADIPVWRRWLTRLSTPYESISYDVHVGEGRPVPDDWPEPYRSNAHYLSLKRIDAVITFADHILIVEVKHLAGWKAIGQTVGYPILYADAFHPELPVATLLLTEAFTLDTQRVMDELQIPYEIVPLDLDVTPPTLPLPQ